MFGLWCSCALNAVKNNLFNFKTLLSSEHYLTLHQHAPKFLHQMMMSAKKNRVNKQACSVFGCFVSHVSTNDNIKFYRFPGRSYEQERRMLWIKNVNRKNLDGSLWQPTKNSRICSQHFIGNEKSNHAAHPSYVPTIFPNKYGKVESSSNTKQKCARYERLLKRKITANAKLSPDAICYRKNGYYKVDVSKRKKNFSSQVNLNPKDVNDNSFVFECSCYPKNNVAVQTEIGRQKPISFKSCSDEKVGAERTSQSDLNCGFYGY